MKKLLLTIICFAFALFLLAQDSTMLNGEKPMGMRANEKIYVVVAVIGTILAGFFIYMIRLDRKIGKMEKSEK